MQLLHGEIKLAFCFHYEWHDLLMKGNCDTIIYISMDSKRNCDNDKYLYIFIYIFVYIYIYICHNIYQKLAIYLYAIL